jgi:8-oxo-dGTP pyrophosphatase MutT (NUDIX family)
MVVAVRKNLSPLHLGKSGKRDVRTQFAALPYRIVRGKCEVLLITSRETGRWIIPKGWPEDGMTAAASAAREAWEEAGIEGRVSDTCLGIYSYLKVLDRRDRMPIVVAVFPVQVRRLHDDYPEKGERKRKWFSRKKAAARVQEPELGLMLKGFDPGQLHL